MSARRKGKMKPDAWIPMFIGDFLAGTSHISTELKGAYILILWAMWKNGARVPNDDEQLATISGLGLKRWRAAKSKLMPFFLVEDLYLTQKRLTEEYQHAWAVYGKRVDSGKQGGRPRVSDLFEETERDTVRDTERLPVRGAERPPQSQSQSDKELLPNSARADSPEEGPSRALNDAAHKTCKALAKAGLEVSTADPLLVAALGEGITSEQLIALAATKKGQGKPLAYLVSTLRGQKADAAASGSEQLVVAKPADPVALARDKEIEQLEASIYDARHLCDTSKLIEPEERDRRIREAKARIRELSKDMA